MEKACYYAMSNATKLAKQANILKDDVRITDSIGNVCGVDIDSGGV